MLNTSHVVTFGLTESQNRIIEDHLKPMKCSLAAAKDYHDLIDSGYFLSVVNPERLEEVAVGELIAFYTEVDGGLTEKIMLSPRADRLSRASQGQIFPDFSSLEAVLVTVLQKAYTRARKEENTIHNISSAFGILREIRNHPGITTLELSEKTDRNPSAVRRYIEALRLMGEDIVYDGNSKSWNLQNGASVLLGDLGEELVHAE